ncbi:MAG: carboxypeptidase-like regulatory domain-containing protein, partial [Gemmatimonas sp.]
MHTGLRGALTVGVVALLPLRGTLASPRVAGAVASRDTRTAPFEVTVQGTVTDTAGTPLSNVQVVANGVNRAALTDERGRFVFRGLPAG